MAESTRAAAAVEPDRRPARDWTPLRVFALRAIGLYFAVYYLETQVGDNALPGVFRFVDKLSVPLDWLVDRLVPWIGARVFGMVELSGGGAGSGDGPMEWIQTFLYVALAVTAAAIWTGARPRPRHADRADRWLRAFIRYPLAFMMIKYGVMKIARTQFGTQPFQQLMTPLGEFSPPALMWAFMSSSFQYRAFAGLAELIGGLLLLSRRTTTLGALIVFAAMTNVLAMNIAYDVSVKMLAGHLVLMSVILLVPELRRLGNVFVLNRATAPVNMPSLVPNPRVSRMLGSAAIVYAVCCAGIIVWDNFSLGARMHAGAPSPIAGLYDVESLIRNGRPITGASDTARWNRVAIEITGFMTIQYRDDRVRSFMTAPDSARRLVVIRPSGAGDPRFDYRNYYIPLTKASIDAVPANDTTRRSQLALDQPDQTHVRLRGTLEGDSIDVLLRRFDEARQLLRNWGGTHFVNRMTFSGTWIVAPYSGWPMGGASPRR